MTVAKKRRPSQKKRKKAIKKQLQYIQRNLAHIESMGELTWLTKYYYKMLLVITEVYRQQLWMYENKTHGIAGGVTTRPKPIVSKD